MKLGKLKITVCLLLIAVLIAGFASVALAAPGLQWQTERVYYDDSGRIVVDGYFYNNSSRIVTWVNWYNVKVYFRDAGSGWWLAAAATFHDLNVYLYPGDSVRWKFRIANVNYYRFDYWQVNWNVNFNLN